MTHMLCAICETGSRREGVNVAESVFAALAAAAAQRRERVALHYLGERLTFGELLRISERLAAALHGLGVRPGERVLLYLAHSPQWIMAWLAAQRLGAVAVPVTHIYGPKDLHYIANDSGAETIFCLDTNFGYVSRVLDETPLKRVVVTSLADLLPAWKRLVGRAFDKIPSGRHRADGQRVFRFGAVLRGASSSLPPLPAGGDRLAEMIYTGGTTGKPKGVPISHALFLECADAQRANGEGAVPRGTDVVLQGAPLYHILGQVMGLGALLAGETLVLLPKVNLDAILDHIQRYRVKTFFGTPALYRMILEHDRLDAYNLGSLRYCFSGGDVLPRETALRWQQRFGLPIHQGYGTTETCGGVALVPAGQPFPPDSVGRVLSIKQVRLAHPDTLAPVPDGEPGELLVHSPHMVRGYWNKPEETARSFVELDGRLWYRTGDVVRIDADGWLYFVDRSADIIKHKGYRVAAAKVEAVLQEHPAVVSACVIGVPDRVVGERIKAYVVPKEDVKGVGAQDLIRWCRERLAPYEVPGYIEFRDMLPKSKVGKLLRRELRDEERRKVGTS